jgi:hypothetical protein
MGFDVTTDGRVYLNGKEKKQSNHSAGYKVVWLNGKVQYVHRLVAEKYIDNPNNLPTVNHKNGIKNDNRVENLEWTTKRNNCEHARLNGLSESKSFGIHNLTFDQYLEIFKLRNNGLSYRKISEKTNIEHRRVWDIYNKKRYKDYYEKMIKTYGMSL